MQKPYYRYKKLIVPASKEVVSVNQVKEYLSIANNDEDGLISLLIKTARQTTEKYLDIALVPQTWESSLYGNIKERINLFPGPVTEIKAINIVYNTSTEELHDYEFHPGENAFILLNNPITNTVKLSITYVAGHDPVPEKIIFSSLKHISYLYTHKNIDENYLKQHIISLYKPQKDIFI